jgi:nucleotide-binding universal stress UspA family protein
MANPVVYWEIGGRDLGGLRELYDKATGPVAGRAGGDRDKVSTPRAAHPVVGTPLALVHSGGSTIARVTTSAPSAVDAGGRRSRRVHGLLPRSSVPAKAYRSGEDGEEPMSADAEVSLDGPVVVGVDGSAACLSAVEVGVREAALRGRVLRMVHAFVWPYLDASSGRSSIDAPEGGLRHDAESIVADAVARARALDPEVAVTGEVAVGTAAAALLARAENATVVVVGDRGLGGFTGLLVGSVAMQLAAHARCPVLVARGEADATKPVLVGVEGSPANDAAVGFAFEEAALRGVPLIAMHAWTDPLSADTADNSPLVYDLHDVQAEEEGVLAGALAGWDDKYPDVVVHRALVRGGARGTLIDGSRGAQLAVVGSRGRGGFPGLVLGSVSQAVLHHASCPVAVVPHAWREDSHLSTGRAE